MISKVSKGSKMDQVYLPKNRYGFGVGSYVLITSIESKKEIKKPYFYHVPSLAPIKVQIIRELFALLDTCCTCENAIITGSFLDRGFQFHDIDVLVISEEVIDKEHFLKVVEHTLGIKVHLLTITTKELLKGLTTDPLYHLMLSSCVAKKRFIYHAVKEINYTLLDVHLLKSKTLIDNCELIDGNEKWYLTRNMICILLFLNNKKIEKTAVEKETEILLNISVKDIQRNLVNKEFFKNYKRIYQKTFTKIMEHINDTKQK